MRGTLSKQLGVQDDEDEDDEHGNDGVRDELLLVHSTGSAFSCTVLVVLAALWPRSWARLMSYRVSRPLSPSSR